MISASFELLRLDQGQGMPRKISPTVSSIDAAFSIQVKYVFLLVRPSHERASEGIEIRFKDNAFKSRRRIRAACELRALAEERRAADYSYR